VQRDLISSRRHIVGHRSVLHYLLLTPYLKKSPDLPDDHPPPKPVQPPREKYSDLRISEFV